MEPMQRKLASSQFDFGYTEKFCIPGETSVFFSSCDSVAGDSLEFNQANRGSLLVWLENTIALDTMQGNRASSRREGKVSSEKGKWQNQNWSPGRLTSSRHLIPEQQVLTPEDCLMNSFLDAYPPVKKKKKVYWQKRQRGETRRSLMNGIVKKNFKQRPGINSPYI